MEIKSVKGKVRSVLVLTTASDVSLLVDNGGRLERERKKTFSVRDKESNTNQPTFGWVTLQTVLSAESEEEGGLLSRVESVCIV